MELLADIVPYEMFEISILYDTYSDKVKSFKDINDITPFSNDITEDTFSCSIKVSFLPAINDSHDTKLVQIPRKLQSVSPTSYIIAIVRSSFYLSIYLKKKEKRRKKEEKKGLDDWPESRDTAVAFSIVIKPFRGGSIDRSFETRGWTINDRVLQARTAGYSAT